MSTTFRAEPVRVRVPATSANLGPGFDSFGLALGLYDDVLVRATGSGLTLDLTGEGAQTLPRDERHLIVRTLRAAFEVLGGQPGGLEIACTNRIPHGRGLGSSAAAIVTGVVAARALAAEGPDRLSDDDALALATEIEGHPDNVAACLFGGFTLAWTVDGRPGALKLVPAPQVVPLVFIPSIELSTAKARGLLPDVVPHADAAANAARAALLVEAITRRPDLLLLATEDRLHQDYRAPAMPESLDLVRRLRADGVPAVVSGAGPTVLALAAEQTADRIASTAGPGWRIERPGLDHEGATVRDARDDTNGGMGM